MENFALSDVVDFFKRIILWIIVTIIFTSKELRDEASRHFYSGVIRIPCVFYGCNPIMGYRSIGQIFPERCRMVRLDFVLGFVKSLLLTACVMGLILLMAKNLT